MLKSALELTTPPDTYRCTWTLSHPPDDPTWRSEGDITLLGDRQPAGGVYGRAPINAHTTPTGFSYGAPQRFKYPMVSGELANGRDVILVDANLTVWHHERGGIISGPNAHFDAWAALVGHGIPKTSDVLVDSGVIQLTHLDAFAARAPIDQVLIPNHAYEDEDPTFGVRFRKASYQTWSDSGVEVTLEYRISATPPTGYYFRVAFSPTVRIELTTPIPIKEFFTSWVLPLHGVVSASTGQNEDITYWSCSPLIEGDDQPPARRQFEVFVRWVKQAPYSSENTRADKRNSAIRLAEGESLLDLLRHWRALEVEQNPILNTYDINLLGSDQASRGRFLLLVQALEGLCGHEERLKGRWARFERKRERILGECRQNLAARDVKFLEYWLPDTPYNLGDALTEMLRALPTNLEPELAQSDLVRKVIAEVDGATNTVEALRYVRNQLSHGTKTFGPYSLHVVAAILSRVVRGHVLRLLQASEEAQVRALARPEEQV